MQPPNINLQPGMTGNAVKQLQDFLVNQGVMTQAQVNTGYGTYGPQTKAAVTKWQQQNNVQAGSNFGYWGPLSIAAASKPANKADAGTPKSSPSSSQSTQPAQGVPYDPNLNKLNITQDTWNKGNATQQAVWSTLGNVVASANQTPISSITMQEALTAAQNDPNITKQFADTFKLDTNAFNQTLGQLQTAMTNDSQKNQMQFEADRKQLAEQSAAAGQAYSGFRGKAQENLAANEAGIVTSSRSQYQKNLNGLTSSFESRYGTKATPVTMANYVDPYASSNISLSGQYTPSNASSSNIVGQTTGGITGSQSNAPGGAEYNAINAKAADIYKSGVLPT